VSSQVLLQFADLLSSVLELPEWSAKLIFLIQVIGFIPALILVWVYDLTPDGIKVTPSGDGDVATGKRSLFLLAIMIGSRWIWRSNLEVTKNV
jgi:hypothetical protein